MGPCCDLLIICSPRFSAYCGLMRATVLGSFANTKHSHRTEQDSKKTSEVERSVSGPSRDLHLGQNLRPAQATAIQEPLSKNSLPRERCFVTRIVPRSPGPSALQARDNQAKAALTLSKTAARRYTNIMDVSTPAWSHIRTAARTREAPGRCNGWFKSY
jgi:hypothetical protein